MTAPLPCKADPELWYDDARIAEAKTGCVGCPVRDLCLHTAVELDEPYGVWGGLSAVERVRLAAGHEPGVCVTCGLAFVPRQPGAGRCDSCAATPRRIEDDLPTIAAMVAAGRTTPQIALALGWSARRVGRIRAQHRLPSPRPRGVPQRPDAELRPCGTPAAYRRHQRRGQRPCMACRQAHDRAQAERQARRTEAGVAV